MASIQSLDLFTSQVVLKPFDAQSFEAQPFAPHVGHSPPLIPSPLHVSQGDIFLFNGVERILVVRCATLIILLIFFEIYGQKCC